MSKLKNVGIMALIAFAVSMVLVGDAVAGEKHRLSVVYYTVKFEQMKVPGEEGHIIGLWEAKGITRNKDGKRFGEGLINYVVGYLDMNMKAGIGSGHFYEEYTDRDGNKFYGESEGKLKKGEMGPYWEGKLTITRGIGKYEGIRGEVTFKNYPAGGGQSYSDWDVEVELPR